METGKSVAQGGLLPLYIKAKKDGLYLTKPQSQSEETFDSQITVNNREEIIQDVCNNIVMNSFPHYPSEFIQTDASRGKFIANRARKTVRLPEADD